MVYDKDEAMRVLQEELNWYYYCGKHYEVTFTKYFQGIVLTQKFNIDKRKLHLSELILCKQIDREEALNELKKPIYPENKIIEDTEYVIKKFGIYELEFKNILMANPKPF